MRNTAKLFTVTVAAVALAAACDQSPTAVPMADEFDFAAAVDPGSVAAVTQVTVCKEGPAGHTYSFTVVANTGNVSLPYTGSFTLQADECKTVAVQADLNGANGQSVTVTELTPPVGTLFNEVDAYPFGPSQGGLGPATTSTNPEVTATPFGEDGGWVLVYKNIAAPVTGCTLTQGYWKTHSEFGPAPYNDTWALLPSGASTVFFLSGQTWYQVFWTEPKGGNAYYNLAHQFEAAILNLLAGASAPAAVNDALTASILLFNTYTPAQIGALKGNDSLRQNFLSLAGTLGDYNEGITGPGHCE